MPSHNPPTPFDTQTAPPPLTHSDCLLLRRDALIDGELNITIKYTGFKNKVTFADINTHTQTSSKQLQFSSLIKFLCTVISSGVGTLLAAGESNVIQVVKMASHAAEHGGICGAKEPSSRSESVMQLQGNY